MIRVFITREKRFAWVMYYLCFIVLSMCRRVDAAAAREDDVKWQAGYQMLVDKGGRYWELGTREEIIKLLKGLDWVLPKELRDIVLSYVPYHNDKIQHVIIGQDELGRDVSREMRLRLCYTPFSNYPSYTLEHSTQYMRVSYEDQLRVRHIRSVLEIAHGMPVQEQVVYCDGSMTESLDEVAIERYLRLAKDREVSGIPVVRYAIQTLLKPGGDGFGHMWLHGKGLKEPVRVALYPREWEFSLAVLQAYKSALHSRGKDVEKMRCSLHCYECDKGYEFPSESGLRNDPYSDFVHSRGRYACECPQAPNGVDQTVLGQYFPMKCAMRARYVIMNDK